MTTSRQIEAARLRGEGLTYATIGRVLDISRERARQLVKHGTVRKRVWWEEHFTMWTRNALINGGYAAPHAIANLPPVKAIVTVRNFGEVCAKQLENFQGWYWCLAKEERTTVDTLSLVDAPPPDR